MALNFCTIVVTLHSTRIFNCISDIKELPKMFGSIEAFLWATFLCLTLSIVWHFVQRRRKWVAIIEKIPGPAGHPLFGVSRHFLTSRENISKVGISLIEPYFKDYPLIQFWAGPFPVIVILKAEAVKVLLNSNSNIDKAIFYRYTFNWIGDGLLTSTGSKWQHRRKLITPSFHFRILENFLLVMNEQASILIQLLDQKYQKIKNNEFDIYPFITRCTLDIICETAMGQGVKAQLNADSEYVNAVNNLAEVITQRMIRPWLAPDWIFRLSSIGRLERHSLKIVHGFTNKIIQIKRSKLQQLENTNDSSKESDEYDVLGRKRRVALLDMLLEKSSEDTNANGQPLTDEDIREEVDTFMFEGHDTTSVGISWALYCIGQYPFIQQKIVDELDAVFGDSDRDSTSQDLHHLKYLECVIKESLRLFSPVPFFGRTINEEMDICGYKIPPGVQLLVSPIWVHQDPVYFPEPEKFDPDRFLPENTQTRDPFAYIPFSAGLRNCIGQKFALMEEKVVLSRILRKFKVTAIVEEDVRTNFIAELVLRPIRGIRVQLEPRQK